MGLRIFILVCFPLFCFSQNKNINIGSGLEPDGNNFHTSAQSNTRDIELISANGAQGITLENALYSIYTGSGVIPDGTIAANSAGQILIANLFSQSRFALGNTGQELELRGSDINLLSNSNITFDAGNGDYVFATLPSFVNDVTGHAVAVMNASGELLLTSPSSLSGGSSGNWSNSSNVANANYTQNGNKNDLNINNYKELNLSGTRSKFGAFGTGDESYSYWGARTFTNTVDGSELIIVSNNTKDNTAEVGWVLGAESFGTDEDGRRYGIMELMPNTGGGSADGVISDVNFNSPNLSFTGANGGFSGDIDISEIDNHIFSGSLTNTIGAVNHDSGNFPFQLTNMGLTNLQSNGTFSIIATGLSTYQSATGNRIHSPDNYVMNTDDNAAGQLAFKEANVSGDNHIEFTAPVELVSNTSFTLFKPVVGLNNPVLTTTQNATGEETLSFVEDKDNQVLNWNQGTNQLSISNANSVTITPSVSVQHSALDFSSITVSNDAGAISGANPVVISGSGITTLDDSDLDIEARGLLQISIPTATNGVVVSLDINSSGVGGDINTVINSNDANRVILGSCTISTKGATTVSSFSMRSGVVIHAQPQRLQLYFEDSTTLPPGDYFIKFHITANSHSNGTF